MNILFISSWYPSKRSPLLGNFVERHAQCIAFKHQVTVIFAAKLSKLDKTYVIERSNNNNLNCLRVYYKASGCNIGVFRKLSDAFRHINAYRILIKEVKQKPDIVHANVSYPIGLLALYLKLRYKLPYVLSEHWSKLDNKKNFNPIKRRIINLTLKKASCVLPVSQYLEDIIISWQKNIKTQIVPNPVNTELFKYQEKSPSTSYRWIHVSTFDPVKNGDIILHTFSNLIKEDPYHFLTIISDGNLNAIKTQIDALQIPQSHINLIGVSSSEKVAQEIMNSDALIQFSSKETFGIVAAEALCCGRPVLSTQVGFLKSYKENDIGLFTELNSNDLLAKMKMMKNITFDGQKQSAFFSAQFNPQHITSIFTNIYNNIIDKSKLL